jgi:hypothetical protein
MSMFDSVNLVAMAPSGTTLVLRDRSQRLWLYPPAGAGKPRVIDSALAEQVIARQDLDRVDRDFTSWTDLDAFRQEQASSRTPRAVVDTESLDLHDIDLLVRVAERWLVDGDAERARALILSLLRVPAVRADQATHDRLIDSMERFECPSLDLCSKERTALQQAARERWDLPRAA